jgi:methionyl-tRNA synthetase
MKKFYVATAIPYVNAKPHIGNAMDYMLADSLARYHKARGDEVFFSVGVDEHGTKIAGKAHDEGITPQAYTDKMVPVFYDFIKKMDVEYTDFIRTTEKRHEGAAQKIWTQLQKYIYKGSYEGWYCSGCESFATDKEVQANNGVCPDHNKPYEKLSEENYFFKLSSFGDQIKQALQAGELKILPKFRETEILNLINSGLEDISISRPVKQLSWGIPVPGDEEHVMYVWFEALMNYITILGYPGGEQYKKFWPADVQIVGKDILRFHAAIWPAMLIGLNIPLPRVLLVHGHVLSSGTKMSKSIGNVVDPIEIIDTYGIDAFRYYFLRHIPTMDDGDFTWEKFETAYNNELANELGNLVQRVAAMVTRYQDGIIGDVPLPQHDTGAFHSEVAQFQLDKALDYVWVKVRELNTYLEEVRPWEIAKSGDNAHLQEVLANCVATLQQIAELLWPFLPHASETITKIFGSGSIEKFSGVMFPKIYKHTPEPKLNEATPPANAAH